MTELTLIGLGAMGATIGHAFLKASYKLTVWNRTPTRQALQTIVQAGATFEPSISKAIANSSTIVFCVLSYDNVNELLSQLSDNTCLSGKTIVNLTNGTPRQARQLSSKVRTDFNDVAAYFDGGIMVPPQLVGHESAFVFVSGEVNESPLQSSPAQSLISVIGRPVYVSPDPGAAALYDLALLAGMYGMFSGSFITMALMKRLQPQQHGLGGVKEAVGNLLVPLLQFMASHIEMIANNWDTEDWGAHGNAMEMQSIGMSNILKACEEEGVDGGALKYFGGLMDKVVGQVGGDGGLAMVGPLLLK